ncbi:hypothetical protein A8U91_01389 [Halomonas elongata]|uniref:Uncharacterized protein n=1 Tax=Halomonas elongata TaxID=2746 RepID=A0A1B8P441_HALEL|nr:DUF523 domain-containing protein [Halomonas elongata]OBX37041.1 hypothetical protein A8U91_01389 [Halomonas elongata]
MEKLLISACLLGQPVRYDGRAKTQQSDILARWREEGRLVTVCPEVQAGLATPARRRRSKEAEAPRYWPGKRAS